MKPHILLVEDNDTARLILAIGLREAGYRVTEATNGEQALDLLEQEQFQVVLTDLVLGEVSGMEVLYTARMQPYHPLVILLTGHGSLDSSLTAFRNGAYDYLLKPCDPDSLLNCVAGAVKRHAAEQQVRQAANVLYGQMKEVLTTSQPALPASNAAPLRVGELVLGHSRRDVSFRGKSVILTPIEYALLRYLSQNPGQPQTYSAIVQQTHQVELYESEAQALIRPHIHNLRTKLAADYLVNERGVGYYLNNPEEDRANPQRT